MGYKFIKTRDESNEFDTHGATIETDLNELTIRELLTMFEDFIKACGFGPYKLDIEEENYNDVKDQDNHSGD